MPDVGQVGAPSTGAVADTGAAAAPSTVDYSTTSDDQILDSTLSAGQDAVSTADAGPASDGETVGAGAPKVEKAAEQQPTVQDPTDKPELAVAEPEELKPLFKQFPQFRNLFYAEKAYREVFPTVAEAREVRTLFPSLDEAKAAVESRDSLATLDDMFYSGDPQRQAEYVHSIHQEDPQAFRSLAQVFPQVLAQVDPEAYVAETKDRLGRALTSILDQASKTGQENVKNAVATLSQALGLQVGQQTPANDPRDAEYKRREQDVQQREQNIQQQQFKSFHASVGSSIGEKVGEAITTKLNEVLKQTEYKPTPDARQELEQKIFQKIDATIKADRALTANLQRAFRAAKQTGFADGERDKCSTLVINRANQLLAKVAAEVVSHWTDKVLQLNKQTNSAAAAAAGRRDITGGAPSGASQPGRIPTSKQIDYAKMDDDAILAATTGKREWAVRK